MLLKVMSDMPQKEASVSSPEVEFQESDSMVSGYELPEETIAKKKRVSFPTDQNLVSVFEIPRRGETDTSSSDSSEYSCNEIDLMARQLSEKVCTVLGDGSSDESECSKKKRSSNSSETKRRTGKSKSLRSLTKPSSSRMSSAGEERTFSKEKPVLPIRTKPSGDNVRLFNKQSTGKSTSPKTCGTVKQKVVKHQSSFLRNNGVMIPPRAPVLKSTKNSITKPEKDEVCSKCGCLVENTKKKSETDKELDLLQTKQLYAWKMANGDIPFPQLTKPSILPLWEKSSSVTSCASCLPHEPP